MLQQVEDSPAVHVRKADVQRDRVRLVLPRERDRVFTALREEDLEAGLVRHLEKDAGEACVVLDHEDDSVPRRDILAVVRHLFGPRQRPDRDDVPVMRRLGDGVRHGA